MTSFFVFNFVVKKFFSQIMILFISEFLDLKKKIINISLNPWKT